VRVGPPEQFTLDTDLARAQFALGREAPIDTPPTWTHGRLEPRAILSDQGSFAGILLWHNFGAGDPAADIGCALNLIPMDMRDGFWRGYRAISPDTAARATAYQVLVALRYIEIDDPFLVRIAWERLIELDIVRAS
jgi:aminoglycoside phosphotransferase (APT) family kinase protein